MNIEKLRSLAQEADDKLSRLLHRDYGSKARERRYGSQVNWQGDTREAADKFLVATGELQEAWREQATTKGDQ